MAEWKEQFFTSLCTVGFDRGGNSFLRLGVYSPPYLNLQEIREWPICPIYLNAQLN
jgi:hypothetical protein